MRTNTYKLGKNSKMRTNEDRCTKMTTFNQVPIWKKSIKSEHIYVHNILVCWGASLPHLAMAMYFCFSAIYLSQHSIMELISIRMKAYQHLPHIYYANTFFSLQKVCKTSPQAKRHKTSLLFTSLTILTFITR